MKRELHPHPGGAASNGQKIKKQASVEVYRLNRLETLQRGSVVLEKCAAIGWRSHKLALFVCYIMRGSSNCLAEVAFQKITLRQQPLLGGRWVWFSPFGPLAPFLTLFLLVVPVPLLFVRS